MTRATPTTISCLLLLAVCGYGIQVNPGSPNQCEVYAVSPNDEPIGTVFVIDRKVFLRGGMSSEVASLQATGELMVERADGWITAGTYDGKTITIPADDGAWTSSPMVANRFALTSGDVKIDLGFTPACTRADAAAGAIQVFEQVHGAGSSQDPQF